MSTSIKLTSLNVSLFDENNEKLDQFFSDLNPDIVCLQEASREVDSAAFEKYISKTAIDKALPQLTESFFATNWALKDFRQSNFHGKELFDHDFGGVIEYGNYVKTKFKIVEGKGIFVQGNLSYISDWESFSNHSGEEPRTVQVVDLLVGKKKIRIMNYHGIWSKDKRGTERTNTASKHLLKIASEVDYPTIICGDFNLFPDTESIAILKKNFISLVDKFNIMYTRPKSNELSSSKRNVVDYIFVSKDVVVNKFEVIDTNVSDHLPLVLNFHV